jgi:1-acyl-sn-glycerol-3-phosphate acyltransferase
MKVLRYVLMPVHLLYKLYVGLVFWTTLFILYPFFKLLLSKRKWFPKAFALKRIWSKVFQVLLFCPVVVEKRGELPPPPYIITSNHSSYMDIMLFYSVFPDYFLFIGKGELLKWPLFKLFFKKMDIPVNRDSLLHSYGAFNKAAEALDKGHCVAIFPEGTIPWSAPRMKSFKNGAFKLATEKNLPVVPVTWVNNYRRFGEPSDLWSGGLPGISKVVVHQAIFPNHEASKESLPLRQQVFRVIDSALPLKYRKYKSHEN